jgi:hypothetical protein
VIVKIPTHDAIWPESVALAVGQQTNTLVPHAQATHFSQRFKAYLSVKIGGDVFANPLGRGFHAHAQKVVHQRFSFPGALGKHVKLGSATASATGLHLTEEVWFGFSNLTKGAIMKTPSVLGWYRILRAHHAWTVFQAVRYALWLAR